MDDITDFVKNGDPVRAGRLSISDTEVYTTVPLLSSKPHLE